MDEIMLVDFLQRHFLLLVEEDDGKFSLVAKLVGVETEYSNNETVILDRVILPV